MDGEPLDTTFFIQNGYVVNELEFVVPQAISSQLECRMEFPPIGLRKSTEAIVYKRSKL